MLKCDVMKNWLKLYLNKFLSSKDVLKLIKQYGSVDNIFAQNSCDLSKVLNKNISNLLLDDNYYTDALSCIKQWLTKETKRYIITLDSDYYPSQLASLPLPPLLFFAEGNIELLKNKKFAIVGTRNPSRSGLDNAKQFAHEIADQGYTIVSGLAEGIDASAHTGALNTVASTIAVLGTGINKYYPKINVKLQDKIKTDGLLVSPFMIDEGPKSFHFPNRNKVIVGLSQGCLVIESKLHGGSMISANFAADIGVEVFAIPGSIHNINSHGCHKLIKNGAKLVENIHDIFEEIPHQIKHANNINLSIEERAVLEIITKDPMKIEEICLYTGMQINILCDILLNLELKEIVKNSSHGYYKLND